MRWARARNDRKPQMGGRLGGQLPAHNGQRNAASRADIHNQTLRLNMFIKLGGTALRVKLSNRFSTQPLVIGGAHVALRRSANARRGHRAGNGPCADV